MREVLTARGHENVLARHESTFEVTSEDVLSPAGDCILAVGVDRVPADFDDAFVAACRDADATIVADLAAGGHRDRIVGAGHPDLTFADEVSAVGRTSDYVDDRTIMVGADKAAGDVDRDLVAALADGAPLELSIAVE